MSIKEFAEKFIKAEDEAFHKGNFELLSKTEDPNVVYHMPPLPDMMGHEAHKQDIVGTRQALSETLHRNGNIWLAMVIFLLYPINRVAALLVKNRDSQYLLAKK